MNELHNALLIHNPNAGGGGNARRSKLDEARRVLESRGIRADLQETTGPGEATEIAKRATTDGRQLVIACGGDGTINEIVNGLANSKNGHRVPLALLPAGTANVLAKELELSWDIPRAAENSHAAKCANCSRPGHSTRTARKPATFLAWLALAPTVASPTPWTSA
jgi:diacylglycerol kinase family enzyme